MPRREADHGSRGKQVYTSTVKTNGLVISFVVPETFEARITGENSEPESLDSTWLEGEKFELYHQSNPKSAKVVAEQIAKLWVNKAFAPNSFFHADLHQGNMKIYAKSPGPEIRVGFLDFGMSDSLADKDKATITKLGFELAVSRNPRFVADYIWQLSNQNKNLLSQEQFRDKLKGMFAAHRTEGLDFWLRYGLSVGVALKKNINSFSRGLTAIALLLEAGDSTTTVSQLLQRAITQAPLSLTKNGIEVLKDHVQSRGFSKKSIQSCDDNLKGTRGK